MYDDEVFADPFGLQLTIFEISILIGISPLLLAHIGYEIVISKISTGYWHNDGNNRPCTTAVKRKYRR